MPQDLDLRLSTAGLHLSQVQRGNTLPISQSPGCSDCFGTLSESVASRDLWLLFMLMYCDVLSCCTCCWMFGFARVAIKHKNIDVLQAGKSRVHTDQLHHVEKHVLTSITVCYYVDPMFVATTAATNI